jgi:hypothetical protein
MGIYFGDPIPTGPNMTERNSTNGYMWVVLRREVKSQMKIKVIKPDGQEGEWSVWHIQGIASDELTAIKMCVDENYMIGPLPVDNALPENRLDWAGAYFPLAKDDPIKGQG